MIFQQSSAMERIVGNFSSDQSMAPNIKKMLMVVEEGNSIVVSKEASVKPI
jgi:hypothetical protein